MKQTDTNRVASEQISLKRQKKTAEVFTPFELVHDINSILPDKFWYDSRADFCDPAAGDGNILVCIYKEKLWHGHEPIQALSTIYGVDIIDENIKVCKKRLFELAISAGLETHKDYIRVDKILDKNIVWANSLEYDFKFRYQDNRAETSRMSAEDTE